MFDAEPLHGLARPARRPGGSTPIEQSSGRHPQWVRDHPGVPRGFLEPMRRRLPITLAVSLSAGMLVHAADDLVYPRFSDYVRRWSRSRISGVAAAVVGVGDVQWEKTLGRHVHRTCRSAWTRRLPWTV